MYFRNEKLVPVDIKDELKKSYIDYAMSVIVGRALPDVRDGLKPVHRRILYTMSELGLGSSRAYRKSARVVGDAMGKYHPHGDSAIYDALVRMAQTFNMRAPLVDGQGNFGSIDGDPAAAMRYTESRLTPIAGEMLGDIGKNTVDMVPNFDGSLEEPTVLPAAMPNLLVNGSSGIAVGMATNIPPHNLGEIVDGLVALIDNPEMTADEIMKYVPGPDFPTGGLICGRAEIVEAYRTGRGRLVVRARASTEQAAKGRERIIVTELPYQVNKARLFENIARLVREKRLTGISDLRDESDKDGMRMVIEIKRGELPDVVLNQLYKHTQMQDTFGIIMLALVDGQPRVLNIKQAMHHYLDHRAEVVRRRTQFDLDVAERRAHIIEGLRIAVDQIDEVVALIRASSSPDEARAGLMDKFELSEEQAKAILEMRLQRLTGLERDKLVEEYEGLIKEIARLNGILLSQRTVLVEVEKELLAVKKKYANPRRTEILGEVGDFRVEDLIADEDMVITISHTGYIKRLPVSTYRKQHRGGKGVTGMETRDEDFVEHVFIASTHQYMLFFTDRGRVHWLKVHEIPRAGRLSKGRAIVNMLQIESGEAVTEYMSVREFSEGRFILMATQRGVVKKTPLTDFSHPRKGGIIAILLNEKDRLIQARLTDGEQNILLATRNGQAIRFRETDVRSMGRPARGVRGVSLGKKDEVIGMTVVPDDATVLVVTENGYGKRTRADAYRLQKRGGKGVINVKTTERNGVVVSMMAVQDNDELVVVTSGGKVIRSRIREISVIGRNTQGMRIINVGDDDRVGGVACVETEDETETAGNGKTAETVVEETETVETTEPAEETKLPDKPEAPDTPAAAEKTEEKRPKRARKGTSRKK